MATNAAGTGRLMNHGINEQNRQILTVLCPASSTTGDTVTVTVPQASVGGQNPMDPNMLPTAVVSQAKSSSTYTNTSHTAWTHNVSTGVTTITPAATIAAGDLIIVTYAGVL